MSNFKLVKHYVKKASFIEDKDNEKKTKIEVNVEGGALVPKDIKNAKHVAVKLRFCFGKEDEFVFLTLETLSKFQILKDNDENEEITEDVIQTKCFPIALAELRKTVKKVSVAYGMPELDLPPFEEEMID